MLRLTVSIALTLVMITGFTVAGGAGSIPPNDGGYRAGNVAYAGALAEAGGGGGITVDKVADPANPRNGTISISVTSDNPVTVTNIIDIYAIHYTGDRKPAGCNLSPADNGNGWYWLAGTVNGVNLNQYSLRFAGTPLLNDAGPAGSAQNAVLAAKGDFSWAYQTQGQMVIPAQCASADINTMLNYVEVVTNQGSAHARTVSLPPTLFQVVTVTTTTTTTTAPTTTATTTSPATTSTTTTAATTTTTTAGTTTTTTAAQTTTTTAATTTTTTAGTTTTTAAQSTTTTAGQSTTTTAAQTTTTSTTQGATTTTTQQATATTQSTAAASTTTSSPAPQPSSPNTPAQPQSQPAPAPAPVVAQVTVAAPAPAPTPTPVPAPVVAAAVATLPRAGGIPADALAAVLGLGLMAVGAGIRRIIR